MHVKFLVIAAAVYIAWRCYLAHQRNATRGIVHATGEQIVGNQERV